MNLPELSKPESLTKIAYDAIHSSILSGQLTVDVVYKEKSLAEDLGISRTPVREALLALSSEGLITFLPRKGLVVNKFSKQDIEEIFEIRESIELASVKKICRNHASLDFSHLRNCFEDQKRSLSIQPRANEFMNLDRDFHMAISELVGNSRLVSIMTNVRDKVHLMGLRALSVEGRMEEVIEEHEKIVAAVENGREEEALALMEYHLYRSKKSVKINKM
ncbi:MAG: GntR family transcriptional regulator [Desulfobulbaceae bacterium]|nr:GntR family transcriptional regulator [Desulfobulbaceae bacterium]